MSDPVGDEELVRRALQGNQGAFGELIERHQVRIYRLCLRILGNPDDAHDAAQDTFLTAVRKLEQFRGDAAFSTWLHRIGVNACYDSLRGKKRRPMLRGVDSDESPQRDIGPAALDHADEVAGSMDVAHALAAIPEDYRIVLVLADVQDQPYEEIAKILDVPVGTVKSRVHRGRIALAKALGIERSSEERDSGEPGRAGRTSEGQS